MTFLKWWGIWKRLGLSNFASILRLRLVSIARSFRVRTCTAQSLTHCTSPYSSKYFAKFNLLMDLVYKTKKGSFSLPIFFDLIDTINYCSFGKTKVPKPEN